MRYNLAMDRLRLFMLGTPRIARNESEISFNRRKGLGLLAYVAMKKKPQSRDTLASLLWPEFDKSRGRNNLRRELSLLNSAYGQTVLVGDRQQISLNQSVSLWTDVDQFYRYLAKARLAFPDTDIDEITALEQSVEVYNDDFLSGFSLPDSIAFDDWQYFEAENLRSSLADVLRRLVNHLAQRDDLARAIDYCRRWIALDPINDLPQRQLMELLGWSGQRTAALRSYIQYRGLLELELGVLPEERTTALYRTILEKRLLGRDSQAITEQIRKPVHNLPAQVTEFVGRDQELAQLTQILADKPNRLISIVAPGGMGKTRLAMRIAEQQLSNFPDGVFLIELASLTTEEDIIIAIMNALDYRLQSRGHTPKQELLNFIRSQKRLLVMDNCEHLLSDVNIFGEILRSAPQVKILATSRKRLNLTGEVTMILEGLDTPSSETSDQILDYSAGKLFRINAERARPDYKFYEDDLIAVVKICQITEGMPLAILLAAAWMHVLTPSEIVEEIQEGIDFLESDLHDVAERHRSIHAVFNSTWNQLSKDEQGIMMHLSIFQDGFTGKAMQKITGSTLRQLASLMNRALIRQDPDTARYDIHELLRQYLGEKLKGSGMLDVTLDKHCDYYLSFAANLNEDLKIRRVDTAIQEFSADLDNIRFAWQHAVHSSDFERLGHACDSITTFYSAKALYAEGIIMLRSAIEQPTSVTSERIDFEIMRIRNRQYSMQIHGQIGTWEQLREPLEQNLAVAQKVQDYIEIGLCQHSLTFLLHFKFPFDTVQVLEYAQASLHSFQQANTKYHVADVQQVLGYLQCEFGETTVGLQNLRQSVALSREIGNLNTLIWALTHLARNTPLSKIREIREHADNAYNMAHSIGSLRGARYARVSLAYAELLAGNFEYAQSACDSIWWNEDSEFDDEFGKQHYYVILSLLASIRDEDYQTGLVLAEKSLVYAQNLSNLWLDVHYAAHCIAHIGLKSFEIADQFVALTLDSTARTLDYKLMALSVSAIVAAEAGKYDHSVHLLALAFHNAQGTTNWMVKWPLLNKLRSDLEAKLTFEYYLNAWEHGKTMDLQQSFNELLREG